MEDKSEVLKLSDRPKRQWKKLPDDFMKGWYKSLLDVFVINSYIYV